MTHHGPVSDPSAALSRDECLALVAAAPYGRVVYTADALPAVLPVMFVLDGGVLLFDVAAGSALAEAGRDGVLAFHADWVDVEGGRGWSVTMTGRARHVLSAGSRVTVALDPELVTGHRAVIAVPRRAHPDAAPN